MAENEAPKRSSVPLLDLLKDPRSGFLEDGALRISMTIWKPFYHPQRRYDTFARLRDLHRRESLGARPSLDEEDGPL